MSEEFLKKFDTEALTILCEPNMKQLLLPA